MTCPCGLLTSVDNGTESPKKIIAADEVLTSQLAVNNTTAAPVQSKGFINCRSIVAILYLVLLIALPPHVVAEDSIQNIPNHADVKLDLA